MNQLVLTNQEISEIKALVKTIARRYNSAEDGAFVHESSLYAHELPRRVRAFLNDFRMREPACGWCLISGYPINHAKIGKTPSHWKVRPARSPALEEEALLVLFGSLLGDLLGWATQQDGHLIHDVFPIKGHEDEQLGTGSEQLLTWHNEDAFHPYRGDYLSMLCLRNPDRVATNLASVNLAGLEPAQVRVLFEPRFTIRPDESHLEKNSARLKAVAKGADPGLESAFRKINEMNARPEKIAVLYGDPRSPYLRIDPYFMDELTEDAEAQRALDALIRAIDAEVRDLVLEPGEFVFIDNFKAVHGRRAFRARYDGNDRWLKRINLARDLRKSRDARPSCESRLLS